MKSVQSTRIVLSDKRATRAFEATTPRAVVEQLLSCPIEACSNYRGVLVNTMKVSSFRGEVPRGSVHALIDASHLSFATHCPLILSPDIIWLTIAQGLANHINLNAERLRHIFVPHQGKEKLSVRRDAFVKGSPENPWEDVFAEFSSHIKANIGERTHTALVPHFSTTGPIEKAAFELVLMDAMKSYFTYAVDSFCGVPEIKLEGTVEDWKSIRDRVSFFSQLGLERWTQNLIPVLDKFIDAIQGSVDKPFWRSYYKYLSQSGGDVITGWISNLFPYIKDGSQDLVPNSYFVDATKPFKDHSPKSNISFGVPGPDHRSFPSAMSQVPFHWNYQGQSVEMNFSGGLIGIRQDQETLALKPEIGWAVYEPEKIIPPEKPPESYKVKWTGWDD
ncbi:MAG: DUF4419 domain-containing protein [Planctomycetota bacterium]|nr:DUF4419 domain-containing protein [Planctomycetota bacterium]